jgi:putative flippase GtrA
MKPSARTWWIFNAVGLLGFAVQLAALWLLHRTGVHPLMATGIAVESAVLHNFVWHERVTWPKSGPGVLRRLLRFHVANGLISVVGNVALTWLLAQELQLPLLLANAISVGICALLNFAASDRWVFAAPRSLHAS